MKVIFLDMDGVLNSADYLARWRKGEQRKKQIRNKEDRWVEMIDKKAVKLLNEVIEATDAKVVISSTWRILNSADMMQSYLNKKGFKGEVIGQTPRMPFDQRGDEIKRWLDTHKNIESFVIFDDDSDMDAVKERFIHTS
jgi:hypothetical protein